MQPWTHQLLAVLMAIDVSTVQSTKRPVWGVLTEPTQALPSKPSRGSFVSGDYVKWLESAGARVVPIFYDQSEEQLDFLLDRVNGILFPGGSDVLYHTQYYNASKHIFARVLRANRRGNYLPVHGTCLGLELIAALVEADPDLKVLSRVDARYMSLPLTFVEPPENSRLFSYLSHEQLEQLATRPLTENRHHLGVAVDTWEHSEELQSFFRLISVSRDRKGLPFVSTIEARDYPITAVQWHPEKSLFDYDVSMSEDHSLQAVKIMQLVADYLVQESRKSTHTFGSPAEESAYLINQYPVTYNGRTGYGSIETYVFEPQR